MEIGTMKQLALFAALTAFAALPAVARADDTLTGKMVTKEEKLTVPAGKYEAFVGAATLETKRQKIEVASYFVKDVGIAKIRIVVMGQTVEVELEKFEAGK